MQKSILKFVVIASILSTGACISAQEKGNIAPKQDASKPWMQADPTAVSDWQDMRFGVFIHWGPVSLTGKEIGWSRGAETPIEEYDNLYKKFNPVKFNADEWVSIAKAAGMKYIVLTTKHHDGFCLWDSKETDYDIMSTPFKRDVTKELAEACRKQGIGFAPYYSVRDWRHPDYPMGGKNGGVKVPGANMDRYTDYMEAQLKELVTNYGPLTGIWFDGTQYPNRERYGQYIEPERGERVVRFLRTLQPSILVNDRIGVPGDYYSPEQKIGGFNTKRPWETCMTICKQWSWKPNDQMKPLKQCLQTLIQTAGGGGNLLFNVGPNANGEIEPEQVERLKAMGAWLKLNGESIYGTRGGPFKPASYGVSTHKGRKIYIHLLRRPNGKLLLPLIAGRKVVSAKMLVGGKSVKFKQDSHQIALTIPGKEAIEDDLVVVLTMNGSLEGLPAITVGESVHLFAAEPATYGMVISRQAKVKVSSTSEWMPADGGTSLVAEKQLNTFAIHTGEEVAPFVDIDLGKLIKVTGLVIRNTDNKPERMATLSASVSKDGKNWSEIWKAGKTEAIWEIPVTTSVSGADVPGREARYIRLQTKPEKPNYLVLKQVEVYGKE